jgi:hypothetical protein
MAHNRRIPDLDELMKLEMSQHADLWRIEIIMLVLYTGPMVRSRVILIDFNFCFSVVPLLVSPVLSRGV